MKRYDFNNMYTLGELAEYSESLWKNGGLDNDGMYARNNFTLAILSGNYSFRNTYYGTYCSNYNARHIDSVNGDVYYDYIPLFKENNKDNTLQDVLEAFRDKSENFLIAHFNKYEAIGSCLNFSNYNPIENYSMTESGTTDRTSNITDTLNKGGFTVTNNLGASTQTNAYGAESKTTEYGEVNNMTTYGAATKSISHGVETDTDQYGAVSHSDVLGGSTDTSTNGAQETTVANGISGFNSSGYSSSDNSVTTIGGRTDSTVVGEKTNTHSEVARTDTHTKSGYTESENNAAHTDESTATSHTDSESVAAKTDTISEAAKVDSSETSSSTDLNTKSGEDNETFNHTKSGNIGVTTTQQMIEQELQLRKANDFMAIYIDDFIHSICIRPDTGIDAF